MSTIKLFHWTKREFLQDILNTGLKPSPCLHLQDKYVFLSDNNIDWKFRGDILLEVNVDIKNIRTNIHPPMNISFKYIKEYLHIGIIDSKNINITD